MAIPKYPITDVSKKDIKDAMKALSGVVLSARQAGKSFQRLAQAFSKMPINNPNCKFQFRDDKCGYKGPAKICNKTFKDCTLLGNVERFGGFPPQPEPLEIQPNPAMIEKGGLFYEEDEGDALDAEKYSEVFRKEYQGKFSSEGTFATGGMVPQGDFPSGNRSIDEMKELLLKDVAMKQEAMMFGNPTPEASEPVDVMWVDEEAVFTKSPEGIPQREWDNLSESSQELILKQMGYNREERKQFKGEDRAIDL